MKEFNTRLLRVEEVQNQWYKRIDGIEKGEMLKWKI